VDVDELKSKVQRQSQPKAALGPRHQAANGNGKVISKLLFFFIKERQSITLPILNKRHHSQD